MGQANRSNSESLSWRDFSIKLVKQVMGQGGSHRGCGGNWASRTKGAAEDGGKRDSTARLPAEAGDFPLALPFLEGGCHRREARRSRAPMDVTGAGARQPAERLVSAEHLNGPASSCTQTV